MAVGFRLSATAISHHGGTETRRTTESIPAAIRLFRSRYIRGIEKSDGPEPGTPISLWFLSGSVSPWWKTRAKKTGQVSPFSPETSGLTCPWFLPLRRACRDTEHRWQGRFLAPIPC